MMVNQLAIEANGHDSIVLSSRIAKRGITLQIHYRMPLDLAQTFVVTKDQACQKKGRFGSCTPMSAVANIRQSQYLHQRVIDPSSDMIWRDGDIQLMMTCSNVSCMLSTQIVSAKATGLQ